VNTPSKPFYSAYNPSLDNLRSLLFIRSIALLGQAGVVTYVLLVSRTTESLWGVTVSLAVLVSITGLSLWRCTRQWPVTDHEFLAQLLIDVIGWTVLMYYTGGANNPFVSYYIVPLVIAAAVLPWRNTWLVAGTSLLAYSALLYYYRPFPLFTPHAQIGHGNGSNVHILGMWFNFLFSAGLITYFVVRMAVILRQRDAREVAQREDRLRDDQIMAVASLAAGTAHELATPMTTMTVLVDEMLQEDNPALTSVMARGFKRRGFIIHSCANAEEALADCADFEPSHILLDLNMPGATCSATMLISRRPTASTSTVPAGSRRAMEVTSSPW
tara:strand:- start:167369 stop:168352 length:984 start_codon:yes stop_codon:yes gene_type:complete